MKVTELVESLSRVAYHYTNIAAAVKILESGEFQLSSIVGSVEQQYAPEGYPFFLSTTRTRRGGYHDTIGAAGVMFVLDGNWFNQHYKSSPVDYWVNRNPQQSSHRAHEAEDRVYSRDPSIPINGVVAVHLYLEPPQEKDFGKEKLPGLARRVLLNAKKRGIAAYLYEDKQAWRNIDTRKAVPITSRPSLRGHEQAKGYVSTHKGYLQPWLELIFAQHQHQLSKRADSLRYSLLYDYDKNIAAGGLENDMGNARKPGAGRDREAALKIIKVMREVGITSTKQLAELLSRKWKTIGDNEQKKAA